LNNTIYLSSSLVEQKSITAIRDVIIEEYGHFIDAQINTLVPQTANISDNNLKSNDIKEENGSTKESG
jgi:hypothetical protein